MSPECDMRTLTPEVSEGSLHRRSRDGARTLTPTHSVESLHKSSSGRLVLAPQLRERVGEGQCRTNGEQLYTVTEPVSAEPTYMPGSPSDDGKMPLGQSLSITSLLSVDSDNSAAHPIGPPISSKLNTGDVLQSSNSWMGEGGTTFSVPPTVMARVNSTANRNGKVLSVDVKNTSLSSSPGNTGSAVSQPMAVVHAQSAIRDTLYQQPTLAELREREQRDQNPPCNDQPFIGEPSSPQPVVPEDGQPETNAGAKQTTKQSAATGAGNASQTSAQDSGPGGPAVQPQGQPSNTSQPTWVIAEVIDFNVPQDDGAVQECDDYSGYAFGCRGDALGLNTRGHLFDDCIRCVRSDPNQMLCLITTDSAEDVNSA